MAFMPFVTPGTYTPKPGYMSPQLQPELMNMNEGSKAARITGVRAGGRSNRSPSPRSNPQRSGMRSGSFKTRESSKGRDYGAIPPLLPGGSISSQDPSSKSIVRGNFFDDRNGSPVTFSTPLTNRLYTQSKRINTYNELRLIIQYGDFLLTSDTMTGIAKDAALAVFAKLKIFVNKEVRNSAWNSFTLENFNTYITKVYKAVALYYAVDAILSFGPTGNQYNLNIESVRNILANNVNILSEQSRLRRALRGHYLPTNMFKLIHKFSQFHRCSELEDSTAFTFDLAGIWSRPNTNLPENQPIMFNESTLTALYDTTIDGLNADDTLNRVGVISQVFPHWEINDLPLSSNHAQWDVSVYNFYRNIRFRYKLAEANQGSYTTYPSDTGIVNQFYSVSADPSQLDGYIEAFLCFGLPQTAEKQNNGIFRVRCSAPLMGSIWFDASKAYWLASSSTSGALSMIQSPVDIAQLGTVHNVDFGYVGNTKVKTNEFSVVRCEDQRVFALNQEGTEFNTRSFVEFLFE